MRRWGIRWRAPTPRFLRAWRHMRAILRVWGEFVGMTVVVSIILGSIALLHFAAVILTLALPIVLLVIWGHSLDDELEWQDRIGR